MIRFFWGVALAIMLVPSMAPAQNFETGLAAYETGDFATALREWKPLAEQGDALAQSSLGFMYANDNGVPQDYTKAAKWFRMAAEQGNAEAQLYLGGLYGKGQGVPQDDAEAVKWFRMVAEQGDADAQQILGLMYYEGNGVPQDYIAAYMWLNLSAAKGSVKATDNRDIVGKKLNPADLSEAQRRARVCLASTYQDCD